MTDLAIKKYFTTADCAERYKKSGRTISRWQATRGFPKPAITYSGSENLYLVDEVLAWEEDQITKRGLRGIVGDGTTAQITSASNDPLASK